MNWRLALTLFILFSLVLSPSLLAQGGVTGFANVRVSNFYRAQPRPSLVVVEGGSVNTSGTYQPLTALDEVTATLTLEPAGSLLMLVNTGPLTVTLVETNTLISAGDIVLGIGDSATLVSSGSSWIQTGFSDN